MCPTFVRFCHQSPQYDWINIQASQSRNDAQRSSFPHSSVTLIYAFATESHLIVIMGCWAVIKRGLKCCSRLFSLANTHTRTSLESVIITRSDLGVGQTLGFEVTVNENQKNLQHRLNQNIMVWMTAERQALTKPH